MAKTHDELRLAVASEDEWNQLARLHAERELAGKEYLKGGTNSLWWRVVLEATEAAVKSFEQRIVARYAAQQSYAGPPLAGVPGDPSLKLLSDPNDGGSVV